MNTLFFTKLIVWCWIDQLISLWKYSEWYTFNCHAYCNKAVQWELLFSMATINWICRRWCFALNKCDWVSNWMLQINDLYFTHSLTFFLVLNYFFLHIYVFLRKEWDKTEWNLGTLCFMIIFVNVCFVFLSLTKKKADCNYICVPAMCSQASFSVLSFSCDYYFGSNSCFA